MAAISHLLKMVSIPLLKALNAIDKLSITWKSDLYNKIKWDFFQIVAMSIQLYGCATWTLTKHMEKVRWEFHKNATCCLEQILEPTYHKTASVWPPASHLTNHSSKTNKTFGALLKKFVGIHKRCSLMDSSDGWPTKTYIHQPWVDTKCSLEDLPIVVEDKNGWCERINATW